MVSQEGHFSFCIHYLGYMGHAIQCSKLFLWLWSLVFEVVFAAFITSVRSCFCSFDHWRAWKRRPIVWVRLALCANTHTNVLLWPAESGNKPSTLKLWQLVGDNKPYNICWWLAESCNKRPTVSVMLASKLSNYTVYLFLYLIILYCQWVRVNVTSQ